MIRWRSPKVVYRKHDKYSNEIVLRIGKLHVGFETNVGLYGYPTTRSVTVRAWCA